MYGDVICLCVSVHSHAYIVKQNHFERTLTHGGIWLGNAEDTTFLNIFILLW